MRQTTDERLAAWTAETRQIGFRRRNWRVVRRLAGLAIALLVVSLPAEFVFGSRELAFACWIAAALSSAAMLVWFLDDRLFIERLPTPKR